ncbi:SGS domain-containing protein [Lipomyces tetrasporus]|uniref:SGS domain-containing protein n=1 Tax=Lipomyces tetrasporus TaxID=54092 RepID=A0AAD7QYZ0_9ASCO|nr:SGS domain-containing protein [Lipomyces tetrasporus]KAJ8103978.1 SGS domain-containing protein [Lipomyces tetrasporus]
MSADAGSKEPKVRHEWYQTPEDVTFTLFVKSAPKNATTVSIQKDSFSITYPLASGSDFSFEIGPLAGEIDPENSKYLVLTTKIELKLRKSVPGKWAALEASDVEVATKQAALPSYPTSSKKGHKNWDAVALELAKDSLTGDEDTGDSAAAFFKQLYEGADEDTKRAMMKSYVESNGTALSTNWAEVKKDQVKTEPPKGMEAKKWDS